MRLRPLLLSVASLVLSACGGSHGDPGGGGGEVVAAPPNFFHVVTDANLDGDHTVITHPDLDGNPAAIFIVTPVYNPGGVGGEYCTSPVGVEYLVTGHWSVYAEDGSAMRRNMSFAISILTPSETAFVHRSTAGSVSVSVHATYLDSPALNGNPDAVVFVTHAFNAGGIGGMRDAHNLGVGYDAGRMRWNIFHEDRLDMARGQAFHVLVLPPTGRSFEHTTTASNVELHKTYLSNPALDGLPGVLLHVTQRYNLRAPIEAFNDVPFGAFYSQLRFQWGVFNQNTLAPMRLDRSFNVWVP